MERELSPLEAAVLSKVLAGDHPVLRVFQKQLERCTVKAREFTGAGFMTELSLCRRASSALVLPRRRRGLAASWPR